MKHTWTTVGNDLDEAIVENKNVIKADSHPDADSPNHQRKLAVAMAGIGVFLVLVGLSPFIMGGQDADEFSAFLGADIAPAEQSEPIETVVTPGPVVADVDEEDTFDFGSSAEAIVIDDFEFDPIAIEAALEESGETDLIIDQPIETVVTPEQSVTESAAESVIASLASQTAAPVVAETNTEAQVFAVNTNTGTTAAPVDYGIAGAIADTTPTTEPIRPAAGDAPAVPDSGAPIIPIAGLALGLAALVRRHNR